MSRRLHKGNARILVWLSVAIAFASGVSAQAPRFPVQTPDRSPASPAAPSAGKEEPATYDAKFNNAPLEIVIGAYSELTGRTALISPGTSANITLQSQTELTRQEYIRAIESILAMHGIALVPFGEKFVKVVRADTARSMGMETILDPWAERPADTDELISRIVVLKNMEIGEATKLVDGFKSGTAKVQTLDRINGLLITDTAVNINRILQIFEQIDQPMETREQLFVHPVRHAKPSEIKTKLEEIIKDLQQKTESTPTVAMPRPSGPPGVIRARPTEVAQPATSAGGEGEVERGIVRGNVKIVADDRTGILIFITLPANMKFFEDIVQALDVETAPDVLVKVFRLEFAEAEAIAGMLNTLIGAQVSKDTTAKTPGGPATEKGAEAKSVALEEFVRAPKEMTGEQKSKIGELSAQNIKILSDKRTNSLIIMASKSDLATVEEIIKDMDMMLSQVLIEAVIIEINLNNNLSSGLDWVQRSLIIYNKDAAGNRTPIAPFAGGGGAGDVQPIDATGIGGNAWPGSQGGVQYFFTHYGLNVDAVVRAAANDTRVKVLSSPVILTTDNTEAKITATDQIYVFSGYVNSGVVSGTAVANANYETRDIGLVLSVKPHINKNKVVMMEITQDNSQPGEEGAPQAGMKVSSKRTLTASIAVRDKETIILGGQVNNTVQKTRRGIPILSEIPLIGRLFGHSSDISTKVEMMVFITPYVLDTPDDIAAESLRRKRAMDIDKMWQRGWSNSKLAEPTRADKLADKKEARVKKAEDRKKEEAEAAAKKAEEKRVKAQEQKHLKAEAGENERQAVEQEQLQAESETADVDAVDETAVIEKQDFAETDTGAARREAEQERVTAAEQKRAKSEAAAAAKKAEEERLQTEEQDKIKAEVAAQQAEEERLQAAEEQERQKAEAEAAERKAEEERLQAQEQKRIEAKAEAAKRRAEEERLKAEERDRRQAEAQAAEQARIAEAQRLRDEKAAAALSKKRAAAVETEEAQIQSVVGNEETETTSGQPAPTAGQPAPSSEQMRNLVEQKAARWESSLKKIDQLTAPQKP